MSTWQPAPVARAASVVQGDRWRITVLTDGLVRLEWSEDGVFEDRASTFAVRRDLPTPDFTVSEEADALQIRTDRLHLSYDREPFSPSGLSVRLRRDGAETGEVWRWGDPAHDLGGTARTLDRADGAIPVEPGVVTRWGCSVLDDSRSAVFADGEERGMPMTGRDGRRLDVYVFAYGGDPEGALRSLHAVSGLPPLLPRWALGTWWSRYHAYSEEEYLGVVDRFAADGIPLSVAVIDMDWHRVDDVPAEAGTGWTGFSWNRRLFPDPERFLAALRSRGLRSTLNLHPADGVRSFEDAYPALTSALGLPADGTPVPFDVTDPAFMSAYLDHVLRPLEDQGVDFWWIDWQQGSQSRRAGIDPLWVQNHLHFLDSARDGRRPLTFSRYAGPGSHRYPIGFSGDTVISWASLRFQPEFTATAANVGYGWWSHDLGGHGVAGVRDDELFVRWVQLGVYSPVFRLHSASSPFLSREPRDLAPVERELVLSALRLRHRLVPYLHTMNHRAAARGEALVRPLHHLHPGRREAHEVPGEHTFGSELLVAAITSPRAAETAMGSTTAWLPPGTWTDVTTGVVYDGDRTLRLHRDLGSVPALLRAGGILPLAGRAEDHHAVPADRHPEVMEVLVAPGADGRFSLVEDDGHGATAAGARTATTSLAWHDRDRVLEISAVEGADDVVPASRRWTVTLLGVGDLEVGEVEGAEVMGLERDDATGRVGVVLTAAPGDVTIRVGFAGDLAAGTRFLGQRLFDVLDRAVVDYELKDRLWALLRRHLSGDVTVTAVLGELETLPVAPVLASTLAELLGARRPGGGAAA